MVVLSKLINNVFDYKVLYNFVTSDHYMMLLKVLWNDLVNITEDILHIADGKFVKNFKSDKLSDVEIGECCNNIVHNM